MDILKKIEQLKLNYDIQNDLIDQKKKEIEDITDEMKRMQGEYRLLVQLGKEQGLIDEEGNIIHQNDEKPDNENTECSQMP